MRSILLFLLSFFGLQICCEAQDRLVKRNGETMLVYIKEVASREIRYTKSAKPEAIIYHISVDEVARIIYANGSEEVLNEPDAGPAPIEERDGRYYQNNNQLGRTALRSIIVESGNKAAIEEANRARSAKRTGDAFIKAGGYVIGFGLVPVMIGGMVWLIQSMGSRPDRTTGTTVVAVGTAGVALGGLAMLTGVLVKNSQDRHLREAIAIYNARLKR
jgi:hypothetical protein